jgi:hypothetical protein
MAESSKPCRRAERPPPRRGPELRVERVRGGDNWSVVILSTALYQCWIHYDPSTRRSQKCTSTGDDCEGHKRGLPMKYRAYLHAHGGRNNEQHFLELTEECARRFLEKVGEDTDLRGLRVKFIRTTKSNGRLFCEVDPYVSPLDPRKLPTEVCPESSLEWLWQWNRAKPEIG